MDPYDFVPTLESAVINRILRPLRTKWQAIEQTVRTTPSAFVSTSKSSPLSLDFATRPQPLHTIKYPSRTYMQTFRSRKRTLASTDATAKPVKRTRSSLEPIRESTRRPSQRHSLDAVPFTFPTENPMDTCTQVLTSRRSWCEWMEPNPFDDSNKTFWKRTPSGLDCSDSEWEYDSDSSLDPDHPVGPTKRAPIPPSDPSPGLALPSPVRRHCLSLRMGIQDAVRRLWQGHHRTWIPPWVNPGTTAITQPASVDVRNHRVPVSRVLPLGTLAAFAVGHSTARSKVDAFDEFGRVMAQVPSHWRRYVLLQYTASATVEQFETLPVTLRQSLASLVKVYSDLGAPGQAYYILETLSSTFPPVTLYQWQQLYSQAERIGASDRWVQFMTTAVHGPGDFSRTESLRPAALAFAYWLLQFAEEVYSAACATVALPDWPFASESARGNAPAGHLFPLLPSPALSLDDLPAEHRRPLSLKYRIHALILLWALDKFNTPGDNSSVVDRDQQVLDGTTLHALFDHAYGTLARTLGMTSSNSLVDSAAVLPDDCRRLPSGLTMLDVLSHPFARSSLETLRGTDAISLVTVHPIVTNLLYQFLFYLAVCTFYGKDSSIKPRTDHVQSQLASSIVAEYHKTIARWLVKYNEHTLHTLVTFLAPAEAIPTQLHQLVFWAGLAQRLGFPRLATCILTWCIGQMALYTASLISPPCLGTQPFDPFPVVKRGQLQCSWDVPAQVDTWILAWWVQLSEETVHSDQSNPTVSWKTLANWSQWLAKQPDTASPPTRYWRFQDSLNEWVLCSPQRQPTVAPQRASPLRQRRLSFVAFSPDPLAVSNRIQSSGSPPQSPLSVRQTSHVLGDISPLCTHAIGPRHSNSLSNAGLSTFPRQSFRSRLASARALVDQ
ncbi:hypothetical protein IWQ61_003793 [Dispira simplex]|nr:hypothetical protein IWQ61_003793 [Dispira simplex]